MGIRFEKDSILNWINEMGKFLRLLVDKQELLEKIENNELDESGYKNFFATDREFFLEASNETLEKFAIGLEKEQVRPLALLMMYDGLFNKDSDLLKKAKFLLEWHMKTSGDFSFEDYGYLAQIDKNL